MAVGAVGASTTCRDRFVLGVVVVGARADQVLEVVRLGPILEEEVEGPREPVLGDAATGRLGVEAVRRVLVQHLPNGSPLGPDR